MKRIAALLLALILALQLTACGEVKKTEALIAAIGEVGPESRDAIDAAQSAYDALSEADRAKVANAAALADAQENYAQQLTEQDYLAAERAAASGDYDGAAAMFTALGDYRDAQERAANCRQASRYAEGEAAFSAMRFAEAAEIFAEVKAYEDAAERILSCGEILLENRDYEAAVRAFAFSDSADAAAGTAYAQGCIALQREDYEAAQEAFLAAGDDYDAPERADEARFLRAEACWREGLLNRAGELYRALPADYARDGVKAAERLALLEKYRDFAALCGLWENSSPMAASVCRSHEETGLWDRWDNTGGQYPLRITCVLGEKGAELRAEAAFWQYVNFSLDAAELQTARSSCGFSFSGSRLPETMTLSLQEPYATEAVLSLEDGAFRFRYALRDEDEAFRYLYTASGTYDTQTEVY